MELHRYLTVLRSRWLLILVTTVVAAGVSFMSADGTARYTARSTIYVGSTSFAEAPDELSTDRFAALQSIALTFSKMIDSQPIALRTVQQLDLGVSPGYVVAVTQTLQEPGTQLIYIDVTDPDPALAQTLSNGLAEVFVETVQEFEPVQESGTVASGDPVPRLPAYVFDRAQFPSVPRPTDRLGALILGGVFGLLASAGLAFLLDYLDLSVRTVADVERRLELPVLGVIPALPSEVPLGQWHASGHERAGPPG